MASRVNGSSDIKGIALEKPSLQALLATAWRFNASDPRDNVFAMVGILRADSGIVPDYSMSTVDVYTTAARLFKTGSPKPIQSLDTKTLTFEPLEGLSYVQRSPDDEDLSSYKSQLPSWVPDFICPIPTVRLWSPRFNAAKGTPTVLPSPDRHVLSLNGFCFDEVVDVEQRSLIAVPDSFTGLLKFLLHLSPIYHTGENRIRALEHTIIAGNVAKQTIEPEDDIREDFKQRVITSIRSSSHKKEAFSWFRQLRETGGEELLPSEEEIVEYNQKLDPRIYPQISYIESIEIGLYENKRLFRTAKGYLGLEATYTQPGDRVYTFAGARTPFILRKGSVQ